MHLKIRSGMQIRKREEKLEDGNQKINYIGKLNRDKKRDEFEG